MTDENKSPSTEEEKPVMTSDQDDIATLEREARAKREAELQASQDDEKENSLQPAVNKLKKRQKGKAAAFLAICAVALIGLTWGGNWVYQNFLKQENGEKTKEVTPPKKTNDYRKRTDLGMATNEPENSTEGEQAVSQDNTGNVSGTAGQMKTFEPPQLNKASFLVRRNNTANPQNQVKTRQQEMILAAENNATQPTDSTATTTQHGTASQAISPATVRRIPYNPDLYIPENTVIPCSMDYRFVSDRAGKIRCTVAKDIWSASGNTKLIEKGTTATGIYQTGITQGQGRAFIMMTKLRTRQRPYLDIPLIDTNAAGELGESGVDGWIDTHFWERFGGALMVGMIPDIGAWASNNAGKKDRNTDYTENSRQAMADMARTTLENSINIPPTLYKNQGEIINLITGQDIDFSNIYTLRLKNELQR
ncbi:TrbI/VirB10 family protein [Escherichia coli]|nr:TrbI/VirB10 family protein [Escherichia coli]